MAVGLSHSLRHDNPNRGWAGRAWRRGHQLTPSNFFIFLVCFFFVYVCNVLCLSNDTLIFFSCVCVCMFFAGTS